MDHLLLTVGGVRILVADPSTSVHGKRVGFGNLVRHTQEAFEVAHGLDARLCLVWKGRAAHPGLSSLVSPDVATVPMWTWQHRLLGAAWHLAAPARYGGWRVWRDRVVSSAVRGSARRAMTLRARVGDRGSRVMKRADRAEKWARALSHESTRRSEDRWRVLIREAGQASRGRLRKQRIESVRVTLPDAVQRDVERQAAAAGIPLDRPLVTLHVREGSYTAYADRDRHAVADRRNARISTYEDAVRRLTTAGYFVVRIGDRSMTPIAWNGVADVATAPWRTDELELWCVLRSRFFIASDSGPYFLTRLANLPCLALNVLQVGFHVARERDRFICKRARNRATGRLLSIAEMLAPDYLTHGLDPQRYDQVDNTPEDLAAAVDDMIAVVGGDLARSPAQTAYDQAIADLGTRWGKSSRNTSLVVRRHALGTMARPFADRYFAEPAPVALRQTYGH